MNHLAESPTRNFFRLLHRKLLCSAATLLLATTGCQSGSKTVELDANRNSLSTHWDAAAASPPIIPDDVEWAVQGRPPQLQKILELASQDVPPHAFPPLLKRLFRLNSPLKSYPNSLRSLGLNDQSIVTLVGSEENTILAFKIMKEQGITKTVQDWNLRKSIHMRSADIHGKSIHLTWNETSDSQYLFTVVENNDDSWVFVGIPPHFNANDPALQRRAIERFGEKIYSWSLFKGKKWSDRFKDLDEEKSNYFSTLSAYGTFYPAALFKQEDAPPPPKHTETLNPNQSKAQALKQQLLNELGQFVFATVLNEGEGTLSISIEQQVTERTKISDNKGGAAALGHPKGEMPLFSSLAPTGALGIIHIAFDPQTLFHFIHALLPTEAQNDLNTRLTNYHDKMDYDVKKDLVDNLTGHATAFIYGLSGKAFEHAAKGSLIDLMLLKDARKSILIPFENNIQIVEFLDITTQLFPNHFVRNGNGYNNIEYVWHDKDVVQWGLFVHNKVLIYVDSYEAYRRALKYDGTSVDTLLSGLNPANAGVRAAEDLFSQDHHDTGIYLNLEGIGTLLSQDSYYSDWAFWLHPFSTALLISSSEHDHTFLELDLTLKKYADTPAKFEDNDVDPVRFIPPQDTRRN